MLLQTLADPELNWVRTSKQKLGKYIKQLGIRTVDVKKETKRYFMYVISAPDLLRAYKDRFQPIGCVI